MKKFFALLLVISILLCSVSASAKTSSIVSLEDFVYRFNFISMLSGDAHSFDSENVEVMSTFHDTIMKAIYNDCEILSLTLDVDMDEVEAISCTLSPVNGSDMYMRDFLNMLVLVFYAAGLDDVESGDYFEDVASKIKNGSKNYKTTVDGVSVTYTQTKAFGITFRLGEL